MVSDAVFDALVKAALSAAMMWVAAGAAAKSAALSARTCKRVLQVGFTACVILGLIELADRRAHPERGWSLAGLFALVSFICAVVAFRRLRLLKKEADQAAAAGA